MTVRDYSTTADDNISISGIALSNAMLANALDNAIRQSMADTANFLLDVAKPTSTAGTGNAFTLSTGGTVTAYTDNIRLAIRASFTNTSSCTINVDGVGIVDLKVYTSAGVGNPASGQIQSGGVYDIMYVDALGDFVVLNPTSDVGLPYDTVALLLASTEASRGTGAIWEAQGFRYEEVASGGDVTTAGSVQLDVLANDDGSENVKAFGALCDGATDDTAAWNAALTAHDHVTFSGTSNIDGVIIPSNGKSITGDGYDTSVLKVTTAAPSFGIDINGSDKNVWTDFRIMGDGDNDDAGRTQFLIKGGAGASYFNRFTRVWFGPCKDALTITTDFYWSTFTDCVFRDNNRGFVSAGGQDANAITFTGCTFYHWQPTETNTKDCIDIANSDGVVFQGCHLQNQGIKLDNCQGVLVDGGYFECFDRPAIEAVNGTSIHMDGNFINAATRMAFDESSAKLLTGVAPAILVAKDAASFDKIGYGSPTAVASGEIVNLFADTSASTQAAVDALDYSPTGGHGSKSINGSSNLEITMTTAGSQRNGFKIVGGGSISVLIKFRVTSGEAKLALANTVTAHIDQVDSTSDTDWHYYRATSSVSGSDPAFVFTPITASATVEIDTIVVCSGSQYIADENRVIREAYFDEVKAADIISDDATIETMGLASLGILNRVIGSGVSIPTGGAVTTLHTFSASEQGFWFVSVDQDTFARTDQAYWSGFVFVGTNSDLDIFPFTQKFLTASNTGLAFEMSNASVTKTMYMKAIKLADA